ncbi:unnamed protein product [Strongylus vulgaris]|uniref:Cyclin-dependent kinase 2-associated protein n=1 Tax=Strongylus vulgaris TaxID=40348 RepID=A0A3P7JC89_STRVU|nr:unnamed protein product [Strongylus vulgaris]
MIPEDQELIGDRAGCLTLFISAITPGSTRMADDLSTASLPQYSVPGPQIASGSKYQQLLAVIEELGKDIRPTYTGNKICAERLKRSIAHSRILVRLIVLTFDAQLLLSDIGNFRECLIEAEKDRQKAAADAAVKNQ